MSKIVEQLTRQQIHVARTNSFNLERPDAELRRLAKQGTVTLLAKGFYALVPENRRSPETNWQPTIEGAALGMAAAIHNPNQVALVGPSAARVHRCYPRALGSAHVSVPTQRRARQTALGNIQFVTRDITKMDTVRVETDLGPGWATSIEQTALDLTRTRPDWGITEETRSEMLALLSARIDWELIDQIALSSRGRKALQRLSSTLDQGNR